MSSTAWSERTLSVRGRAARRATSLSRAGNHAADFLHNCLDVCVPIHPPSKPGYDCFRHVHARSPHGPRFAADSRLTHVFLVQLRLCRGMVQPGRSHGETLKIAPSVHGARGEHAWVDWRSELACFGKNRFKKQKRCLFTFHLTPYGKIRPRPTRQNEVLKGVGFQDPLQFVFLSGLARQET